MFTFAKKLLRPSSAGNSHYDVQPIQENKRTEVIEEKKTVLFQRDTRLLNGNQISLQVNSAIVSESEVSSHTKMNNSDSRFAKSHKDSDETDSNGFLSNDSLFPERLSDMRPLEEYFMSLSLNQNFETAVNDEAEKSDVSNLQSHQEEANEIFLAENSTVDTQVVRPNSLQLNQDFVENSSLDMDKDTNLSDSDKLKSSSDNSLDAEDKVSMPFSVDSTESPAVSMNALPIKQLPPTGKKLTGRTKITKKGWKTMIGSEFDYGSISATSSESINDIILPPSVKTLPPAGQKKSNRRSASVKILGTGSNDEYTANRKSNFLGTSGMKNGNRSSIPITDLDKFQIFLLDKNMLEEDVEIEIVRADSFFTKNGTKNENSLFTSSGQSMADDFALRNDLQEWIHKYSSSSFSNVGILQVCNGRHQVYNRSKENCLPVSPADNIDSRMCILKGFVHQDVRRYMLLFPELLLIAKQKSQTIFKLKNIVPVSNLWLTSSMESFQDAGDVSHSSDRSIIIGWPMVNTLTTFPSSEQKMMWSKLLERQIGIEKQKFNSNQSTVIKVFNKDIECTMTKKALAVGISEKTSEVLLRVLKEFRLLESDQKDYQMRVVCEREGLTFTLSGYENPYSIQTCLQQKHNQSNETEASQHDVCHFELTVKKKSAAQKNGFHPNKRSRRAAASPIVGLFRKSPTKPDVLQATPSGRLFGHSLQQLCINNRIPKPIMDLLQYLYDYGPSTVGVFRKSANQKELLEMKTRLDLEKDYIYNVDDTSVHVAAATLKNWLRDLTDCLLVCDFYFKWLEIAGVTDINQMKEKIKRLVSLLPRCHMLVLCHVICILHRISLDSHKNKMTSYNLAVCIGPTILRPVSTVDLTTQADSVERFAKVIQTIIDHAADILGQRECVDLFKVCDASQNDIRGSLCDVTEHQDDIMPATLHKAASLNCLECDVYDGSHHSSQKKPNSLCLSSPDSGIISGSNTDLNSEQSAWSHVPRYLKNTRVGLSKNQHSKSELSDIAEAQITVDLDSVSMASHDSMGMSEQCNPGRDSDSFSIVSRNSHRSGDRSDFDMENSLEEFEEDREVSDEKFSNADEDFNSSKDVSSMEVISHVGDTRETAGDLGKTVGDTGSLKQLVTEDAEEESYEYLWDDETKIDVGKHFARTIGSHEIFHTISEVTLKPKMTRVDIVSAGTIVKVPTKIANASKIVIKSEQTSLSGHVDLGNTEKEERMTFQGDSALLSGNVIKAKPQLQTKYTGTVLRDKDDGIAEKINFFENIPKSVDSKGPESRASSSSKTTIELFNSHESPRIYGPTKQSENPAAISWSDLDSVSDAKSDSRSQDQYVSLPNLVDSLDWKNRLQGRMNHVTKLDIRQSNVLEFPSNSHFKRQLFSGQHIHKHPVQNVISSSQSSPVVKQFGNKSIFQLRSTSSESGVLDSSNDRRNASSHSFVTSIQFPNDDLDKYNFRGSAIVNGVKASGNKLSRTHNSNSGFQVVTKAQESNNSRNIPTNLKNRVHQQQIGTPVSYNGHINGHSIGLVNGVGQLTGGDVRGDRRVVDSSQSWIKSVAGLPHQHRTNIQVHSREPFRGNDVQRNESYKTNDVQIGGETYKRNGVQSRELYRGNDVRIGEPYNRNIVQSREPYIGNATEQSTKPRTVTLVNISDNYIEQQSAPNKSRTAPISQIHSVHR